MAVCHHPNYLTMFGNYDIRLYDGCGSNTHKNTYSNLGYTYEIPDGHTYGSKEAKSYLAGTCNFKVAELEVY